MLLIVAYPFLKRICDILKAREIHSPMASMWMSPCFLRTSLERKRP
jgi:hypothetical protein